MQTQYALKQAGLTLPVTKEFQQHITTLLANQVLQKITEAVVINFRNPGLQCRIWRISSG